MGIRIERPFKPIGSVRALSGLLQVDSALLHKLATASDTFKYRVVERKPSPDSRLRDKVIYDAQHDLKWVQQRINEHLFKALVYPNYIIGGIPGRNIKQAVSAHLHARSLMTFDVSRFFELAFDSRWALKVHDCAVPVGVPWLGGARCVVTTGFQASWGLGTSR